MLTSEFGNDEVKNKDTLTVLKHIQPPLSWDGNATGCNLAKFQGSGWKKHFMKKKKFICKEKNP